MADLEASTTRKPRGGLAALRWVSLAETLTYCALSFFWVSGNRPARMVMGLVHGVTFLGFVALVLAVREHMGWTWRYTFTVIVLGPIGSAMCYARLRRPARPDHHRW